MQKAAAQRSLRIRDKGVNMILADKIINMRKKAGWSQEELAEQLGVSRQSVSKWESSQSVPDMDKIVRMSDIFSVSTDFLLKDELSMDDQIPQVQSSEPGLRRVSMEEASEFMDLRAKAAPSFALNTLLCVASPRPPYSSWGPFRGLRKAQRKRGRGHRTVRPDNHGGRRGYGLHQMLIALLPLLIP